jgi:hypothetical protein
MYFLYCVIHSSFESTTVCFPLKMKYYAQYVDSRLPSSNHLKSLILIASIVPEPATIYTPDGWALNELRFFSLGS